MASGADITERKKSEEKIQASLNEKNLLLSEVHHRVKNNMQIISSLLNLQSEQIKDRQYVEIFNDSKNRIKSIALVHEKLYKSEDMANIDFSDYIKSLVKDLFSFYEMLSNCLKHAFPDNRKGEVTISFSKNTGEEGPEYYLVVSDNGIGIPEDLDIKKTKSLGMQLITALTEHQLNGSLKLDRKNGTAFHIRFNELRYKKRT